jgi:hypothetical protein
MHYRRILVWPHCRQCCRHKDPAAVSTAAAAGGSQARNHQVSSVLLHPGAIARGPGASGRWVVGMGIGLQDSGKITTVQHHRQQVLLQSQATSTGPGTRGWWVVESKAICWIRSVARSTKSAAIPAHFSSILHCRGAAARGPGASGRWVFERQLFAGSVTVGFRDQSVDTVSYGVAHTIQDGDEPM